MGGVKPSSRTPKRVIDPVVVIVGTGGTPGCSRLDLTEMWQSCITAIMSECAIARVLQQLGSFFSCAHIVVTLTTVVDPARSHAGFPDISAPRNPCKHYTSQLCLENHFCRFNYYVPLASFRLTGIGDVEVHRGYPRIRGIHVVADLPH